MGKRGSVKRFFTGNALSLAMFGLFITSLAGMSIAGHHYYNQEREDHGQPSVSFSHYLRTGDFIEATFENWESEFLSVGGLLVPAVFLRQRGSPESKPIGESNSKTGS